MSSWNWRWWFAWRPVKVIAESGGCWVWMVLVQRRRISWLDAREGDRLVEVWEYR